MPARGPLSARARELLTQAVDSYEKLEIVLQLDRAGVPVRAEALAGEASVPEGVARDALRELAKSRVAREVGEGMWVIDAAGPWREHIAALVQSADVDRTEIFRFMTARAMERVRAEAARVFADAFILRPKKKGDSDG